jgi:hypothetical protein
MLLGWVSWSLLYNQNIILSVTFYAKRRYAECRGTLLEYDTKGMVLHSGRLLVDFVNKRLGKNIKNEHKRSSLIFYSINDEEKVI